ncbi:hypothetical protein MKOR_30300 [Mycolicibacillus koreensis]|nr:hypothetical protein MKOR_30300 [Mycolicibacillus koreensis]
MVPPWPTCTTAPGSRWAAIAASISGAIGANAGSGATGGSGGGAAVLGAACGVVAGPVVDGGGDGCPQEHSTAPAATTAVIARTRA